MKRNKNLLFGRIALFFVMLVLKSFSAKSQHAAPRAVPISAYENHVGLSVKNLQAAKRWYASLFGMKEIQKLEIPEYHVRTVLLRADNGLSIELIEVAGASRERAFKDALDAASQLGYGHWAITVNDLIAAYNMLVSHGATSVSPPAPAVQKGASFAYVKDPEGNLIELMQLPK